jgi:zinc transport system substrate-binding protein
MKDFRNIIFVLMVLVFVLQMILMKEDAKKTTSVSKPIVSLSTFSLYDIANHIAGDSVDLVMILPFGVDAHSFEPTPKLMIKIQKSSLVVYSGAGLEPWIEGFEFKGDVINMSRYVKLRELSSKEEHSHHEHHHGKTCNHSGVDPHYWLDIQNMIKSTNVITDALIKISPKNKELYSKNSKNYIDMLNKLDSDYKKTITDCKIDAIIVNHNAFSYLSNNYGFEVEALSGLSPEAQPSAKNMIKLIEHVKEHNISTIFFESFVSDKAIKSIASEAKVKVDVLQPLGNITKKEADKNLTYEDIMRSNLEKISKALMCK